MQIAYYAVRATIDRRISARSCEDLQLVPGMQTEVYIRTDDRTALDYLIKPLTEQFARTFRER